MTTHSDGAKDSKMTAKYLSVSPTDYKMSAKDYSFEAKDCSFEAKDNKMRATANKMKAKYCSAKTTD